MAASKSYPLIVGGGSGIGHAVALAYADTGRRPVVWDIAGERDVDCDIADPSSINDALEATVERWGLPEELTVTAGVGHSATLVDASSDEWDRIFSTNTRGPWLVMQTVARCLSGGGRPASFVATSSVSADIPDQSMGLYCASKAALNMIVKVAAAEWASLGIRVNAVAPGVTQTPMLGRAPVDDGWLLGVSNRTALSRLGQPDDIAAAVLALHRLDWVTGQILTVDGGLSLHSPIDPTGQGRSV